MIVPNGIFKSLSRHPQIIKSSELGFECWSALRNFDKCHGCEKVIRCKLPEAHQGGLKLLKYNVEVAEEDLVKARKKLIAERAK